ncbi:site-specific DNA-methyltransferase [Campylobacter upsaliensis]|uniref:site-specific DNA-methyltransferase n=1 Tax=Campylobacter upsaliensis TaxID=28080 RepID=UPI002B3F0997|nr:site-specific DNA-methyltransferase [Campylobacter upsaliensis]MEB2815175.1 site-specific DNA-methyltransferase [Campylobacter upsaliensis]MEB2830357.1 site-specific DNA-methyltransferase [Campylobacter upsaliensis]MEB2833801.1 site-specific DNA-methyltransferase [Campylobacter upsaliensis]
MKNELLQDLENRFETLKHIRNLAQSYDEKLFCYLLEQSTYKNEFKNRFFIMRNNTYIFKLNDFLTFLDLRNLSGSFTSYTNKIGLGFKTKSFLKTNNEVVLNFAYKDGVIKGGQSKDEDKKNEIFFNEILAKDEIDVLFARKALQNFELIGQGDLKENLNNANLLIKGNNLLALHSLKKKFANKVKLIYIDPPYNTGNDSFNYNDNFNHSTWLTFMKNRLEIAREFLSDDGVIFIQCDDNEQAYLKVLCDEIFGRDNFVGCCPVVVNRGGRDYGGIAKTHDYLLIYGKTLLTELYQIEDKDKKFQFSDENGGFNLMELRNRNIRFNKENRPNLYYPFYVNPNNTDENELLEISLESKDGFIELYPLESQGINTVWRWGKEKAEKFLNTEIKGKRKQDGGFMIVQKNRLLLKRQRSIWDNREFVNERGTEHIKQMLGRDSFSYPKSEFLLQRILELTTQENDLVMDFFAGSGTTLAVAMKMKRQFIGIEQMDYIESITKERLKKVVSGEQGGISKAVDWQGGGSFIYAELMPLNAIYKERIKNINDEKMLDSIYKDLESKAFLDYRIDLDSILKDKEFKELDLQEKKEVLLDILDSNMDYVLYGDIEDKDYAISSEVIELNKIFYGDCHDFANAKSRNDKKGK